MLASPPVRSVRANPLTGTVLVIFDERRLSLRELAGRLRNLGRRRYLDLMPSGIAPSWAERRPYHAMEIASAVQLLDTSPSGLSSHQASSRIARIGPNRMAAPHGRPIWRMVVDHLLSLPALMLTVAAGLSLATGGLLEAGVILTVVALNSAIGTFMEARAQRSIASLGSLVTPHAIVRRDGHDMTIDVAELVPGDLLILTAGSQVSADARVLAADRLIVNESMLTGESLPVEKAGEGTRPATAPISDRINMVYAGTVVSHGHGTALVTATGSRTELGKIRTLVDRPAYRGSALARDLDRIGGRLVALSLSFSALALALGLLRGVGFLEMLRTAIALAVATVPEGLPTVTTAACTFGMQRLRRGGVFVRQLDSVQRLGTVTVVCVDKTGTITNGRMHVHEWRLGWKTRNRRRAVSAQRRTGLEEVPAGASGEILRWRALEISVLCNEAILDPVPSGSPTELALLRAAQEAGLAYRVVRARYPLLWIEPRGERRNWMATVHEGKDGGRFVAVKGAPEEVLRLSTTLDAGGWSVRLTERARREIARNNARMAAAGMRVLGLAWKSEAESAGSGRLAWIGLVGLADPIRAGVTEALTACRRAGIRVVMLTGDQPLTAASVAREAQLGPTGSPGILDASRLRGLDPGRLRSVLQRVDVFARASPTQKHHIVRALQQGGDVVAMAGDGINDAPALRAADIGIAIGATGTAVARDVADIVLADDDFASLLGAIAEGRTTHANTRKAVRFLLSTNLSEILVTLAALTGGIARPLSPIQFLWMNLLSDVLPALALAGEPPEAAVMDEDTGRQRSVLSLAALRRIAADGAVLSAGTLASYVAALGRHGIGSRSSTVAFSTLTAAQLLHAITCRSDARAGWSSLSESPSMLGAIAATLGLGVAAVTIRPFQRLLKTAPLGGSDWGLVAAGAMLPVLIRG